MMNRVRAWVQKPNPLWIRELKQSARLGRTQWILLTLILGLTCIVAATGGLGAEATSPDRVGQTLYQVFFSLALLVVTLGGPGIAANTIAAEREGKTWEAIQLTGLSAERVIRGKFLASFSDIALYIVALAPIGALPFLLGGVGALEVLLGFVFLFVYAALATTFGLAVSSFMKSTRGALVVTLLLAVNVGPVLYLIFGFGGGAVMHDTFAAVPDGAPIWLPLGLVRGDFGLPYVMMLIVAPILTLGIPASFFYELALSNLAEDTDDRSSRIKKWFAISTVLIAAYVVALPFALPSSTRHDLVYRLLAFHTMHLLLGATLLAGEPAFPSRKVRVHWERTQAGRSARFWGPSITGTAVLHLGLGAFTLGALALAGLAAIPALPSERFVYLAVFLYVVAHFIFLIGLVVWLAVRTSSPMATRLIVTGIVATLTVVPWVFFAVAGIFNHGASDDLAALGAPSAFFVFILARQTGPSVVLVAGVAMSALYILLGLLMFLRGARLASAKAKAVLDREAELEQALRNEDLAHVPPP